MRAEMRKKKRILLRVIGISLLLVLIGAGVYGFSVYKSLTKAVDTMHQPIDRQKSEKRPEQVTLTRKQPFSILMLGVDERKGDSGRSDTMIVLTVNPNLNTVKMLSIPRDTRTDIIGKGKEDKINHAYAFGGVDMSVKTVENFLNIPIDYYMKINMEGFRDIVDAVGGVNVTNDINFNYDGNHFPKGQLTLNGQEALDFSRMRHDDPRGDFGRQLRQREIIQAVLDKGASFTSLTKYNAIFTALSSNVKTNLLFDEMVDIQKNYKEASKNIEQLAIEGKGTMMDGIYYLIISDEEKAKVQNELRTHLELAK
ncbi:LytR family transcriptional regulator [Neobacillus sp. PS3-40]|uniref:polyisoprenyl-teichoic acid--peptidoglycan teichoic acid transferase TagU n=1 Tax=Neobacillus sp. PS3-40 TaxID=3070679 RepID=UPI0027DF7CC7|nr:LytR family transcriptional regulator [Neobacillus sp. PS3-40]WML46123.1 LytR family transcriptional regulator [Neobacillus sp. PS3-40]